MYSKRGDRVKKIISHLGRAFKNSFNGFKVAAATELAVKLELAICIIFIPLAFWVGHTAVERILLISSILLLIITELLNTAIEAVVDRIGTEQHELSGRAKDLGSAAVFVACVYAAVVWLMVLI
ncbi:MAG: diacylglycerol kinase [Gammaproteobacteria bacterium]|nr:diacylglycerol kinase [Gammaproteobacteria bacterium]